MIVTDDGIRPGNSGSSRFVDPTIVSRQGPSHKRTDKKNLLRSFNIWSFGNDPLYDCPCINSSINKITSSPPGKDLLDFVSTHACGRPVILSGDFNAEPSEPIYNTVMNHETLGLASAYRNRTSGHQEPKYTTWKIREEGEVCHTIDYVFFSQDKFDVDAVLSMPSGEQIGSARVPSLRYPSDHFSLVCDLTLKK